MSTYVFDATEEAVGLANEWVNSRARRRLLDKDLMVLTRLPLMLLQGLLRVVGLRLLNLLLDLLVFRFNLSHVQFLLDGVERARPLLVEEGESVQV